IAGLAAQLGASVVETARGIVSVVQTNMLGAIRVVSVRKGYDPRGYTLVAFGGPGPRPAGARHPLRGGAAGGAAAPGPGPHAGRAPGGGRARPGVRRSRGPGGRLA